MDRYPFVWMHRCPFGGSTGPGWLRLLQLLPASCASPEPCKTVTRGAVKQAQRLRLWYLEYIHKYILFLPLLYGVLEEKTKSLGVSARRVTKELKDSC